MKKYQKIVSLLGVVGTLGGAGVAYAVDAKTMMGGACLPQVASNQAYNPWTAIDGIAKNNFSAALTYVCPVVRDNETTTTGLSAVKVTTQTPTNQSFSCTMRSANKWNTEQDFYTLITTVNPGAASNQELSFGANVDKSVDSGHYTLTCLVPPAGKIYGYRWAEN